MSVRNITSRRFAKAVALFVALGLLAPLGGFRAWAAGCYEGKPI